MESVFHVLRVLLVILEVLILFNLLVAVHELGHFLAARWRGLVVDKFRIWFGKPIWKTTRGGVEYSLGWIPAGGFVALPQMAPMDSIEGKLEGARPNLPPVSPWDKIIVAFAGPLFSFGLACVFAVIVWVVGRPVSEGETNLTIGYVATDSPAERAGLRPGDRILEVDGQRPTRFGGMSNSVVWYITRSEEKTIPFKVERDGQILTFQPSPELPQRSGWWRRAETRHVGLGAAFTPMVAKVAPGSPADRAGLRTNDLIKTLNGAPLLHIQQFYETEQNSYGQPLSLGVERDGKPLSLTLPGVPFQIFGVTKGSPAEEAGVKANDVLTAVNGQPATRFRDLREATRASNGQPVELTLNRPGEAAPRTVRVLPRKPEGEDQYYTGMNLTSKEGGTADGITWDSYGVMKLDHPTPGEQIQQGTMSIVNTLGAILSPRSDIKVQHLGGPVMILRAYYLLFESPRGWQLALWFSVILNINLALLNLLPFPVLDGGHITLALLEMIRGKTLNVRLLEAVQTACAMLLIGYMLYITFFDVGDLVGGDNGGGRQLKFRPAAATSEAASPTPGGSPTP